MRFTAAVLFAASLTLPAFVVSADALGGSAPARRGLIHAANCAFHPHNFGCPEHNEKTVTVTATSSSASSCPTSSSSSSSASSSISGSASGSGSGTSITASATSSPCSAPSSTHEDAAAHRNAAAAGVHMGAGRAALAAIGLAGLSLMF